MIERYPYAPVLDWIDGGEMSWSYWKRRYGGGPLSWLRWQFGTHDQNEIRQEHHEEMVAQGQPHIYQDVYYGPEAKR